ncbi:MAG: MFS transporter [Actinomycetota bacterium]
MHVGRRDLARLTAGKATANTAARWIPFFLFVLADAFDTSISTLTLIIGIGEMAGLASILVGGQLDRGRERTFLVAAMILISGSGIIALAGTIPTFAVSFLLVTGGVSLFSVAGHAWLSHRVPFARRARAIGTLETSWALALIVGAPIAALLIEWFGWRGPFVFVAIAGAVMAVVVAQVPDDDVGPRPSPPPSGTKHLTRPAVVNISMSAATAMAGLTTIVIVGTWLEDDFGISTGEVGLTAMAFGVVEISASGGSARFADQLGKVRTTGLAHIGLFVGLIIMMNADSNFAVAAVGLAFFFLGFEYAIVTSFSIVSESAPAARGRALAANTAIGTVTRGGGAVASGYLFDAFGIAGPATLSALAATIALGLLITGDRLTAQPIAA